MRIQQNLLKDYKLGGTYKVQKEELSSIYLLYGEESYLIEKTLKKIKQAFGTIVLGINYIRNRRFKFGYINSKYRNSSIWIS